MTASSGVSLTHKPVLELAPATIEDIPRIREIWSSCFSDPFFRKLFPSTPGVHKWWDDANSSAMLHKPNVRFLKVTDVAAGEGSGLIVGYAKWSVPVGDEKPELEGQFPPWPEDSDKDLCNKFFGHLLAVRTKWMGDRQHYYLDTLGTVPEYRGMGVGSMLVGWGCDLADRDGLGAFVDASSQGLSLYVRFKFEPEELFEMPDDNFTCTSCVRKARNKD